jgi:glutamate dehydrogenase
MGITAKGAWISVQRHFLEMGVDVQASRCASSAVATCRRRIRQRHAAVEGDQAGRGVRPPHIFIDPDPDPAKSWKERERMFDLPRSSWDDYDRKVMSKGGMIVPRSQSRSISPRKPGKRWDRGSHSRPD